MSTRILTTAVAMTLGLSLLAASSAALAAPNLVTTFTGPTFEPMVYEMARYKVNVKNTGSSHANDVILEFDLPETATSPTVYLLGEVGDVHRRCVLDDTTVICNLGRVKAGKSKTRWVELAFPVSNITIAVFATTSSSNAAPTFAFRKPYLGTYDQPITGPAPTVIRHCTGQNLSAFFECEVSPGSIASHETILEADGSITFVVPAFPPGFTGTWSQSADHHLTMSYISNGNTVMTFHGFGTGDDCFEGITTFGSNNPYVSPYEVCL